ncbi:MAG: hypothetical protein BWK80_45425 [Desulfobacteraceae bacterium IS3]|nr:MAG: hypothetical protein BWK80_45425 [Desulfobacteraceae bacterium IS3]
MKTHIVIIYLLALAVLVLIADRISLQEEIRRLGDAVIFLERSNAGLQKNVSEQNRKIEMIQDVLAEKEISRSSEPASWLIVFSAVILLTAPLSFLLMRRKLSLTTERLNRDIRQALSNNTAEADHSMPLRIGQEIHRMRKRIANMPKETKDIRALENSLKRLEECFNESGYEIIDLLGQPFVEGLTVHARFVPSETCRPDEKIISKVIQPQINYNGVLLQAAEVEVSYFETSTPLFGEKNANKN